MVYSMTGFGKAESEIGNKKITVQVKSLNSKQLDINTKLPSLFKDLDLTLRRLISELLIRGKVELSISYETLEGKSNFSIDEVLFKSYYYQLSQIAQELDETHTDLISTVSKLPDVLRSNTEELSKQELSSIVELVKEACLNLLEFRKDEGLALEKDLTERVNCIEQSLDEALTYEEERINIIKDRLNQSLLEFKKSNSINQDRFEQEMIYYMEKYDISEEKVRLKTHCTYFKEVLDSTQSQGKKLGFISQEMGREINTLGSKANHAKMQQKVVEMKDDLEKIKEQILNVQ